MITAVVLVLVTVAFVLWISRARSRWVSVLLDWFPAILFAYVLPAAFTHLAGVDLSGRSPARLEQNVDHSICHPDDHECAFF